MTHSHPDSTITSQSTSHNHSPAKATTTVSCGYSAATHKHNISTNTGNAHTHDCSLTFGDSELGSPNWWEHTHSVTGTLLSGGAAHTHNFSAWTIAGTCADCTNYVTHAHYQVGYISCDSGGAAHTHTVSGTTGNADPAGTPESHVHPVSLTSDSGQSHAHNITGNVKTEPCTRAYNHAHGTAVTLSTNTHTHPTIGNSGVGGEAAPSAFASKRLLVGVGL